MYDKLHRHLKLSHTSHTGKKLPQHHTSYGLLLVLVVAVGGLLMLGTKSANAVDQTSSGSVNLTTLVKGPPPSTAAVISHPNEGQIFHSNSIDVGGTCPNSTVVEIYKNGILAGATNCSGGSFNLKIDLVVGANRLIGKVVDQFGQYGPDSSVVNVSLVPTPISVPSSSPALLVSPQAQYFGVKTGESFKLSLLITGGQQPYAIFIDWGDGKPDLLSQAMSGSFDVAHVFRPNQKKVYTISIKVTDAKGNKAYAQTVALIIKNAIVAAPITHNNPTPYVPESLIVLWPLFIITFAIITTFWLGEKFEWERIKNTTVESKILSSRPHH